MYNLDLYLFKCLFWRNLEIFYDAGLQGYGNMKLKWDFIAFLICWFQIRKHKIFMTS